jgi:2-keto-4-pentenoate hydratase/2-oxohepta-3-ene-1,7-dioic acid hydratase in catechol pathway
VAVNLRAVVFESSSGDRRLGRLDDDGVVDAGPIDDAGFVPTREGWKRVGDASGQRYALADVRLCAPLRPPKILAIGVNYREHAAETHREVPAQPVLFAKFPSSVIGPDDTIVVPREETRPDFEGEVGIVIGRRTYRATRESAVEAVGAVTALNDVSGRRAQFETPLQQFTLGKSFDTFTPIGPCLVEPTGLDLADLELRTIVSGKQMQHASTEEMIHSVVDLIEYLSRGLTLEPGDVIATGTPGGVGHRRDPPRYLREGDVVEVSVTHVGTLCNPVAFER